MINKFLDVGKIILTSGVLILLSLFLCITLQIGPPLVEAIPFGTQPRDDDLTALAALDFNASDKEGTILQVTGTYPNSVPDLVNVFSPTKLILPNADDPTLDTNAQLVHDNDNEVLKYWDGTEAREVVDLTVGQVLLNKFIHLPLEEETVDGYDLVGWEVTGSQISNRGSSGAIELDLPSATTGYHFIAVCAYVGDFGFDPDGASGGDNNDKIILDGVDLTDGVAVTMDCATVGENMTCFTFTTDGTNYDWICTCGVGTCS